MKTKVAIIHYWWISNRGGEAVVASIVEIFPDADIFVHVCDESLIRESLPKSFRGEIYTSFIAKLPFSGRIYQKYLPLMPLALEQWDLSAYDLVISSESGPAKGVITRPDAVHICYCHSPMRYIWDMYHEYIDRAGWFVKMVFPLVAHWLRVWDRSSADRVDFFVANSNFIAQRIRKFYRREADVVFPPVDVAAFVHTATRKDYYLYLGQLVAYKRPDLAINAFNEMGCPLVVIGEGELLDQLKLMAKSNISFMGRQPFSVVKEHLEHCKGLVFPGVEDFGIVPVEAMAAGAPVIAFGQGGILDTVVDGVTGLFFHEQTVSSLVEAIKKIEVGEIEFKSDLLQAHAKKFDKKVFKENLKDFILRHKSDVFS